MRFGPTAGVVAADGGGGEGEDAIAEADASLRMTRISILDAPKAHKKQILISIGIILGIFLLVYLLRLF